MARTMSPSSNLAMCLMIGYPWSEVSLTAVCASALSAQRKRVRAINAWLTASG